MRKLRVYIDTSVIGGCFDVEFARWSVELIARVRRGEIAAVVSEVTAAEVLRAPSVVRAQFDELATLGATLVAVATEARVLADLYERNAVLPKRFRNDMLHIALATVAQVDALASWNFRHIVRFDRIRAFNALNVEAGYKPLAIHSPRELIAHE